MHRLIRWRRRITALIADIQQPLPGLRLSNPVNIIVYVFARLALVLLVPIRFFFELPIHFRQSTTEGFSTTALRADTGQFLESYTGYIKRDQTSVAVLMVASVALFAQFTLFAYSVWTIGRPKIVEAYTTSITLNPAWDITAQEEIDTAANDFPPPDCYDPAMSYSCLSAGATTLQTQLGSPTCPSTVNSHRAGLKFSLSSVPNTATITKIELVVNVTGTTAATQTVYRLNSDSVDSQSCTTGAMYATLGGSGGTLYSYYTNWNTTGLKTLDLGSTAVSDVQSRIAGSDILPLSITSGGALGTINSTDSASNKPQLVITYTSPPQTPTGFAKSAITTSSIQWVWTDTATAETRYDVHDASHTPVTGCTNLAAETQSCTETGLSTNTQYTRHANVTDPNGNTDSASASAYSAIQTPSGITFGTVTTSSIAVTDSGTFTNLSTASSGLFFQESVTSTNSGWIQSNGWTKSGLNPNTQYSFQAKARNGDAAETSLTSAATKYTLAGPPDANEIQPTSTWQASSIFIFDAPGGFGPTNPIQYFRYIFDQSATHVFNGTESTWSSDSSYCPGGTCTVVGPDLEVNATAPGNDWYLHVVSYNAEDIATSGNQNLGPYYFDNTAPTAPATVNDGTGADATYSSGLTTLSANWTASTDGISGIQKYQYAIGTTSGGTQTLGYTDNGTATTVTNSGLSLSNGVTCYISVRAVDNANNTGGVTTSNGITVNTSLPTITDNQPGDTTPRNAAGTTYDIDFSKAASGPQLDSAQYIVYSGAGKTGTLIKNWTDIFTADTDTYTTNWAVDFASLNEGTNYVSVRVTALDALSAELDDAFIVIRDTVAPVISSVAATTQTSSAVVTWTSNESTTSQANYGLTASYGSSTTLNATATTSHSETISDLSAGTTYHYQVVSVDAAGNSSSSSDATFAIASTTVPTTPAPTPTPTTTPSTVPTPTITNLGNGSIIADTKPILAGIGPAKGTIFVVVDRKLVRTVLADSLGRYRVTLLDDLSLGAHQFVVRAKITAGAVSDESRPITVTIVKSSVLATVQKTILTNGAHPSVTYYVVAPGQSTIKFLLDGSLYKTLHAETVIGAYGFILKLDIPSTLTAGQHQFSLFTIDRYRRPSHQVGIVKFTIPVVNAQPVITYGTRTYTVQSGDSLWSIAQKFYGAGSRWTEIQQANIAAHPSLSTSPQTIYAGWTLTIPAG